MYLSEKKALINCYKVKLKSRNCMLLMFSAPGGSCNILFVAMREDTRQATDV